MDKYKNILNKAEELAEKTKTWADLSNALFDPFDGQVVKLFATKEDRDAFKKSSAYKQLRKLIQSKMKKTGLVSGAKPTKSGKFVVRVPRSLHVSLEREAKEEGTSLNQLVITKLAVQLDNLAGGKLASIIQAFGEVRDGYSVDRVIADPVLNRKFLRRCRELNLSGTDFDLNWNLMNARKKGDLSYLPRTKRFTVRETDEFEYASELAVRFLERTKDVSLDQIICDPELAEEFDDYARRLAPGFAPLAYRWVALGLRKAGRRGKKEERSTDLPGLEMIGKAQSLKIDKVPEVCGLYGFLTQEEHVFIKQTENLRHRIERHLEVSNSNGLPEWLWDIEKEPLGVAVSPLPGVKKTERQELELGMIRNFKPILNFPRKVA